MVRASRQIRALYELCVIALFEDCADLDGADEVGFDIVIAMFTVRQAANLANIHAPTLRQPAGGATKHRAAPGATYCDTDRLVQAQSLNQDEGIDLAGITRILELQGEASVASLSQAAREDRRFKRIRRRCGWRHHRDGTRTGPGCGGAVDNMARMGVNS